MIVHDSTRFSLETDAGAKVYEDMLPNGHLVHVGENWEPHTVSMFHQLRCLQIIGETYLSPGRNKSRELSEHCLNYLRQMFLCKPSLQLESIRTDARGESQTSRPYETVCNDWTAVYDAVEENQRKHESAVSLPFDMPGECVLIIERKAITSETW